MEGRKEPLFFWRHSLFCALLRTLFNQIVCLFAANLHSGCSSTYIKRGRFGCVFGFLGALASQHTTDGTVNSNSAEEAILCETGGISYRREGTLSSCSGMRYPSDE